MLRDYVVEKFGSIGRAYEMKLHEYKGELPVSRNQFYNIVDGKTKNPGVVTMLQLAEILGFTLEDLKKFYTEEDIFKGYR